MQNFKDKVIYQIYPKSFKDSDGDGIGDLKGIIEKLDYLQWLGIDYLWITPFFISPQKDNGYDIADYFQIDPLFGNMNDLEKLIQKAAEKEIGIMLDMVFNHTSTEHIWFQKALQGDKHYQDYYIFKDGNFDHPPTNWQSKFGGNAWEYVPSLKKWYLHLFDKTQADLNWDNPKVREELKKVICFWKKKGIKGFRFDVINLISKPEIFEDDTSGDGRNFYTDGPHVHEYLKELVKDTQIQNMITVGEMSSTSIENCIRYTNPKENELTMCFNFHHLKIDYKDGNKWSLQKPDYAKLKKLFVNWQTDMQAHNGWSAVFWCNHDQPRIVSRLGNDKLFWEKSAKMLAASIHMMRGTPYIFQGEEIGMTNPYYTSIGQYRDVESINYYQILLEEGKSSEEALQILQERSRDNSRTPMQWEPEKFAGFSTHVPWIPLSHNYTTINVKNEQHHSNSILAFYKKLIAIRKQEPVISDGDIYFLEHEDDQILAYARINRNDKILVFNNFSEEHKILKSKLNTTQYQKLLGNYDDMPLDETISLRPYETIILKQIKT